jgi:hypothetical protein
MVLESKRIMSKSYSVSNMKTTEVKKLVTAVLKSLPKPYSPHIIDEVFLAIESRPEWRRTYEVLTSDLGRMVVNSSIGSWVSKIIGWRGEPQVPSRLNSLSDSYSILDTDFVPSPRLPKEPEALQIMFDYFQKHKDTLHPDVRKHRDRIVALLMGGNSVEEAFAIIEDDRRRIFF